MQQAEQSKSKHEKANEKNKWRPSRRLNFTLWILGAILLPGLIVGVLFIVSKYLGITSDPVSFVTGNLLNALIFLAIVAQAIIYRKQWEVMQAQAKKMHEQLDAIKEQSKIMERSLTISTRAYVGVYSISIDFETKQISIRIENIGKVPASHINVSINMEVRVPEQWIQSAQTTQPPWIELANGGQSLTWGYSRYFGRAKLFPGNLKIMFPVKLNSWLTSKQIPLIAQGHAEMFFRGDIEFNDGFDSGKDSPFAFRYSHEIEDWVVDSVITREEVKERLAEATEKYLKPKRESTNQNPTSD
jgi:hypothetical protein